MPTNSTDVLVAGAGPTGLMLALELARRGVNLRIVDKLAARSPYSRALVVQARSLELLQNLGLADEFLAVGFRNIAVTAYVKGREMVRFDLGDIGAASTPYPFVLFISQAETERILEQALNRHGITVERSTTVAGFTQDDNGVSIDLKRADGAGETLRCRYLAGCDGAHSVVRHGLGLEFKGGAYAQDFVLADVHIDWDLPHDRMQAFLASPGVMVVFPFPDGTQRIVATLPPGCNDTEKELNLADMQTIARQLSARELTLSKPVWISRFRLHHRGVERYGLGRVFIGGDAAHIHSPAGGQGMNTGIQDAANLAWKLDLALKSATPATNLLDSYGAERVPIGRVLLKRTDRLFEFAATRNRLIVALRNFLLPRLIPRILGDAQRRASAFRFVSQLGIHYRGSPLVFDVGKWNAGPAAGERAPDAPLRQGDNAITLFERMRGTAHRLLVFITDEKNIAHDLFARASELPFPCETVVIGTNTREDTTISYDPARHAHALYGVTEAGAIYLVRPDGYIGMRAPLADAAVALKRYSDNLGIALR